MNRRHSAWILLICCCVLGCKPGAEHSTELEPAGSGPYSVGSTNMEVSAEYADIGDEAMHQYLLGIPESSGGSRYIADILEYPQAAWTIDVAIPDDSAIYGPASGQALPVVTFVTYPSSSQPQQNSYAFPYHNAQYGTFENMLEAGEEPSFADPNERYPLIILAHGASAHGLYDVRHAHSLASHGYIVAVITYGDDRTAIKDSPNHHVSFLRPLLTRAVLDSLVESKTFGSHIDTDNIGITGHSFGGFTALAVAGGPFQGNAATVSDPRIKAGVLAAPWVGGNYGADDFFAFGPNNSALEQVTIPTIWFFGTKDDVTLASFILPAARKVSGATYVVELVDQPHVFEQGSWEDRDNWELLFFSAYLKNDAAALEKLRVGRSMNGGNADAQLFDYQRLNGTAEERGK